MNHTTDLFIGAVNTDSLAMPGGDEALFVAEGTFAGADSDVLHCGDAGDHAIEIEETFAMSGDDDVLATSADSDLVFDVAEEGFDGDDTDVIHGDVWDLEAAA